MHECWQFLICMMIWKILLSVQLEEKCVYMVTQPTHYPHEKMSAVRAYVEWLFADIINYFKFLDFKKNLRIGLSQVGKMYIVCAILRNDLTCLYSNTTAEYFGVDPPSLQDYFR